MIIKKKKNIVHIIKNENMEKKDVLSQITCGIHISMGFLYGDNIMR